MSALLAAEAYKLRTTRASLGTVAALGASVVLLLVIEVATASSAALAEGERQRQAVGVGSVAMIFAALVGILAMTSEFRHGTITPTLLVSPRRLRLLSGKLAAAALVGALLGTAGYGLALAGLAVGLQVRGVEGALGAGDLAAVAAGTIGAAALWAAFGVGLGALVKSQVAAIVGFLLWLLAAEPLVSGLAPDAGRYLPGQAGNALAGSIGEALLSQPAAAALLAAYTVGFALLGAARFRHADVT